MIPLTLFTESHRIDLAEACLDPWTYRSRTTMEETVDVEVLDQDVNELRRIVGMDEMHRRRHLVVSLGGDFGCLTPAELRLEDTGQMVVSIGDPDAVRFLKVVRRHLHPDPLA